MALITCPECSNSVSDSAEFCPNCGYPIKKKVLKTKINKKKRNLIVGTSSIVVILIIIIIILAISPYNTNELNDKASHLIKLYRYDLAYPDSLIIYEMQYFRKDDGTEYLMMYFSGQDFDEHKLYAVYTNWNSTAHYYNPSNPEKSDNLASLIVYTYWDKSSNAVIDVEKVMKAYFS